MKKLTYEGLFFIIITEPVAPGEESVRIGCIKPAKVAQIHAQTHLERERQRKKHQAEPFTDGQSHTWYLGGEGGSVGVVVDDLVVLQEAAVDVVPA